MQRADFNGDGTADFVLDDGKLQCSRPMKEERARTSGRLFVYTSNGIDFVHSLDIAYDSWRLVPASSGKPAGIFAHQNFVPADPSAAEGDGDAVPLINETIAMSGPAAWRKSQLGMPDWRSRVAPYPQAIRDQFATWDGQCRAVGRRLDYADVTYGAGTINDAGDLNKDGRRDYVIDVQGVSCGMFGVPPVPTPPYFCGKDCMLIAIVSAPGGVHVADRVQGSISLAGNGDPGWAGEGKIGWPGSFAPCQSVEVTYQGTRQVRKRVPCPQ